jgi:hypothetical protein
MISKTLSLATLFVLLLNASGQQQSTSATKTGTKPAKPTSVLLADTDDTCDLFLDDTDEGAIIPSQSRKLKATPGEHIVKCSVEGIPDLLWRKVIEVRLGSQSAIVISLKALHIQYDQAIAQQKKQQEQAVEAEEKEKLQAKAAVEEQKAQAAAAAAAKVEAARREEEEFPQRLFGQIKGDWQSEVSCQQETWDDHETRRIDFISVEGSTVTAQFQDHYAAVFHPGGFQQLPPNVVDNNFSVTLEISRPNVLSQGDGFVVRVLSSERIEVKGPHLSNCSDSAVTIFRR